MLTSDLRGARRGRRGPILVLLLLIGALTPCFADLTPDQKVADFLDLAGLYAKNYAPYNWKLQVYGFDALNVGPWLAQVQATTNDLDYYDVCVRYVASLNDSHDEYTLNSDFAAYLPFTVDIYDGKTLIDLINTNIISAAQIPIFVGDELVSVDGVATADLIQSFLPYAVNGRGNPLTARRIAAYTITTRYQSWYPYAAKVGSTAVIAVRNQSTGIVSSYTVPWTTTGLAFTTSGTIPTFTYSLAHARQRQTAAETPWNTWTGTSTVPVPPATAAYLQPLKEWQVSMAIQPAAYATFGSMAPVFQPPAGFVGRLGSGSADQFTSGSYAAGGKQIGFIRIPTMNPANQYTAVIQFQSEIAWFSAHTDALVIDVMSNGGGDLCYTQQLLLITQSLMPKPFRGFAYDIKASWDWVSYFNAALESAETWRADQGTIAQYVNYVTALESAVTSGGLTDPLPVCGATFDNIAPAVDSSGAPAAYTKPILVLVNGLTLSAAEAFSMALQDEGRATIFGVRTDGGGGNPSSRTTTYADGATRVTRTFITRKAPVQTPGFPESGYIENTGVYPDVLDDYMTQANLLGKGAPFVADFTAAVLSRISPAMSSGLRRTSAWDENHAVSLVSGR